MVIRVEQGAIMTAGEARVALRPGMIASFEPRTTHDVHAVDDSVFLLFVAGQDSAPVPSSRSM